MDQNVIDFLNEHQISHDIYEHPPVFTVEESKSIKEGLPCIHTKNLFLRTKANDFCLVSIQADKRLDVKEFSAMHDTGKLSFGKPEQLEEELHLQPGSVSVFGLLYATKTTLFLDRELREAEYIGWHPNRNTSTVVVAQDGLRTYLAALDIDPVIVDV